LKFHYEIKTIVFLKMILGFKKDYNDSKQTLQSPTYSSYFNKITEIKRI